MEIVEKKATMKMAARMLKTKKANRQLHSAPGPLAALNRIS
jgi:hypothetical protein